MTRGPDLPCARCGKLMWRGPNSLPEGQGVCKSCRREKPQPYKSRESRNCPVCGAQFQVLPRRTQRACSQACSRRLPGPCDDCGELTTRGHNKEGRFCEGCAQARRRAKTRAKNHQRRMAGRTSDITAAYERRLRAKARRCPLCSVRLTNRPDLPNSKHLDHIVPVVIGGTNTIGNVRIICRTCNLTRPKDGSDLGGYQLTLWAQDAAFASAIPARRRGLCACGQKKRNGRCWTCEPSRPRGPSTQALHAGPRAAELRAERMKWQDIADTLGLANPGLAYVWARTYGDPDVIARWPQRYEWVA